MLSSALVTGGASGLGAATAELLASRGCSVVLVDQNPELGAPLARRIGGSFALADVRSEEDIRAAIDTALELAPLRFLVNCAGIGRPHRTLDRSGVPHPQVDFTFVLDVNLAGTFNCVRLAAEAMSHNERGPDGERGSILMTASVAAFEGQVGQASYAASKAGVVGMTLPIARDLAVIGVRVNTIAPGFFDTPIFGTSRGVHDQKEALRRQVLFPRRSGRVREFADLAWTILTNSYMNGAVVRLDGGLRLTAG